MCLYQCKSAAPSTQTYHVLPESASNLQITLPTGVVCDKCNAYFSKLESYFVRNHPGSAHRLVQLQQTKKGKPPTLDVDGGLATAKREGDSIAVSAPLSEIAFRVLKNGDMQMHGESLLGSYDSEKISRLLAKIALEALHLASAKVGMSPSHPTFDGLRDYARRGRSKQKYVWFCYKSGHFPELPPAIGTLTSPEGTTAGHVCVITFPGICYLFPYPPMADEVLDRVSNDWTIVGESGSFETPPLKFDLHFKRVDQSLTARRHE